MADVALREPLAGGTPTACLKSVVGRVERRACSFPQTAVVTCQYIDLAFCESGVFIDTAQTTECSLSTCVASDAYICCKVYVV